MNALIQQWKKNRTIDDVEAHILKHLEEVKELITKGDDHRFVEYTDLVILYHIYLAYANKDHEELFQTRLKKFFEKIKNDNN